jgi:hypothetical protein
MLRGGVISGDFNPRVVRRVSDIAPSAEYRKVKMTYEY